MQTYTFALDCDTCGETMYTTTTNLSRQQTDPVVIDLDMAVSQIMFECGNCGGTSYLGDIDEITMHDPGIEGDDDE